MVASLLAIMLVDFQRLKKKALGHTLSKNGKDPFCRYVASLCCLLLGIHAADGSREPLFEGLAKRLAFIQGSGDLTLPQEVL